MKKIGIAFFVFVALVLIGAALFLPSDVVVERTLLINAPSEVVYANVADLRKWEAWSPWRAKDPAMKLSYSGPEQGVGSKCTWESESQGNGSMTISKLEASSHFENDLDFGANGQGKGTFEFQAQGESQTSVTWRMNTNMGINPIGKIFGLFMDSVVGADFEDGLKRLRVVAEADAALGKES